MLDHEDLKWVATTSTELNSMLQQISRYSDLARQHKGQYNYIEMLGERVELASKTAQALFDRVTSTILNGSVTKRPSPRKNSPPSFSVVPPPAPRGPVELKLAPSRLVQPAAEGLQPSSAEPGSIPPEFCLINPK